VLTWEAARDKVLAGVTPLPPVTAAVAEALGRALAEDVAAPEDMPPFDNSAMDGFAVRSEDVAGASPETPAALTVVADQPAGTSGAAMRAGEAVRIMTGAPIPEGADAVVMIEATNFWDPETKRGRRPSSAEAGTHLRVMRDAPRGTNIRARGESVRAGTVMLERGHVVRGPEIGLLLSVGLQEVRVHPLPVVGVLSTGDELVPASRIPGPGQIRDSNRPALLAALTARGFPVLDLGLAGDDREALASRIAKGASEADFLITSGGVSVGDRDLTRDVLAEAGSVESYRVAVKPGKPQLFGHLGKTPVFGLPGNPVSSLVVFDQFVLPALKKMAGRSDVLWPVFTARMADAVRRRSGRLEFLRVRLEPEDGAWTVHVTGPQGSGVLSSMTRANGYAILPSETERLEPGDPVRVQRWDG
jgi:molybdopterin molybdotransferase